MYVNEEVLDIIFRSSINYRTPDRYFIERIITLIASYDGLADYIKGIYYDCYSVAVYYYESGILKFNITKIIDELEEIYDNNSFSECSNNYLLNKYLFIYLRLMEIIFHELEHIKQKKKLDNSRGDNLEKQLIDISLIAREVYLDLYDTKHSLFSIERIANIRSCKRILGLLKLDTSIPQFIYNNFYFRYCYLVSEYYSSGSFPILEFVNATNGKIVYEDILFCKKNTNKILKKTRDTFSFADRITLGLPVTKSELDRILVR